VLNEHTDTEEFYVASTWTDFLVFDPLQVGGNFLSLRYCDIKAFLKAKKKKKLPRMLHTFKEFNTTCFFMHVCNLDISREPFTENVTFSAKYHIILIVTSFSFAIQLVLDQGLSKWALATPRRPLRVS